MKNEDEQAAAFSDTVTIDDHATNKSEMLPANLMLTTSTNVTVTKAQSEDFNNLSSSSNSSPTEKSNPSAAVSIKPLDPELCNLSALKPKAAVDVSLNKGDAKGSSSSSVPENHDSNLDTESASINAYVAVANAKENSPESIILSEKMAATLSV